MQVAGPAFYEAESRAFQGYGLVPRTHLLELTDPPVPVRVLETGSGEAVLFMHGISLASVHWAPIIARLPSTRCIAIDMPGHAGSGAVDFNGVDLRDWHTKLLSAVLDELGVRSAHLVGHSYGGMFALWLALGAPERVRSVISIGTPSIAFGAKPDLLFRAPAWPGVGPLMLKSPMPRIVHRALLARSLGRPAIQAAPPELLRVAYLATRRPGFAATASTYLREQFRGPRAVPPRYELQDHELAQITRPVLIIWGDQDTRYQSVESGAQKASLIPQGRFETVPGGHEPWLDDPDTCSHLIQRHLGRQGPSVRAARQTLGAETARSADGARRWR